MASKMEWVAREVDSSLKRLGTDYVYLYIIHRFDYSTQESSPLVG